MTGATYRELPDGSVVRRRSWHVVIADGHWAVGTIDAAAASDSDESDDGPRFYDGEESCEYCQREAWHTRQLHEIQAEIAYAEHREADHRREVGWSMGESTVTIGRDEAGNERLCDDCGKPTERGNAMLRRRDRINGSIVTRYSCAGGCGGAFHADAFAERAWRQSLGFEAGR